MIKPLGLSESQTQLIENILRSFLSSKQQFSVSVFGSRVRGNFRKYSDLDLWIESTPPLNRQEEAQLRGQFEESDLPIKIDIVTPESTIAEYLNNIISEKKIWLHDSTSS